MPDSFVPNLRISPALSLMRFLPLLAAAGLIAGPAAAQIPLDLTPTRIDYNDFRAAGLTSTPAPGQLDADDYLFLGFSDGPSATATPQFGVSRTTGDFARGTSTGGVTSGGLYAFNTDGAGNYAVGVQPTGSDFVPGTILVRFRNVTGETLYAVSVAADLKVYNDASRATRVIFQVIPDVVIDPATGMQTSTGTPVAVAAVVTPEAASATPAWVTNRIAATAKGIEIPPDAEFYVQLGVFDAGGSGARDEIALDNLVVSGVSETLGSGFQATGMAENVPGWRMLAPVVDGSTIADLADDNLVQGVIGSFPDAGANVLTQYLNEAGPSTSAGFVNPDGVSVATPLASGKGFIWYLYNRDDLPQSRALPANVSYSGTVQTTDVAATFELNGDGFYLAGNPFNQAFRVDGVSAPDGFEVSDAVSVWDPVLQSYVLRSATAGDLVSRGQGFFAEMTAQPTPAPASLSIAYAAAARVATATDLIGRPGTPEGFARAGFTLSGLTAGGATTHDAAIAVVFADEATEGHDRFDGSKPPTLANPSAELAFVGERNGAVHYRAQESRPMPTAAGASLPLALRVRGDGGEYTFRWPGLDGLPVEWSASLLDDVTGQTVDLHATDGYTFTAAPGDWAERFTLVVAARGAVATESAPSATVVRAVFPNPTTGPSRIAFSTASAERVSVQVYDALGRLVATPYDAATAAASETVVALPEGLSPGTYVVRVSGATFAETRRLTVLR